MALDATIKAILTPRVMTQSYNALATGRPTPLTDAWFASPSNMDDDSAMSFYNPAESTPAPTNVGGAVARVLSVGSGKLRKLNLFTVFNTTPMNGDVLKAMMEPESQALQSKGAREVGDLMLRFAVRHRLLKELIIAKTLATGIVYLDINGNVLESSTGAVQSCDFEVPSGNQGNIGGVIDALWSVDTTDIPSHLEAIDDLAAQGQTPGLTDVWTHKKNLKYLRLNTAFSDWAVYNPQFNQAVLRGDAQIIADGLFGKRWHFIDGYYTAADGTTKPFIPLAKAILTPPPGDPWVQASNGVTIVPKQTGVFATVEEALANCEPMYGPFAYASLQHNPVTINAFAGDKFALNFLEPAAIYQATAFPSS